MPLATGTDLFIGREREMAELNEALDSAMEGRGGLVMLVGEPGIGKTRLSEELAIVARDREARVARGTCYEGGSTPPYWPWTQIIRSLLTEPSEVVLNALNSRAAAIAEIVPEIDELIPDVEPLPEVDPSQARFRLFDSVASFLNEVAISQPLVVMVDDLHWADRSTLDLLEFVSRDVASSPMLIVGVYRDMELSRQHLLSETLATLARLEGFLRVTLRGLASDDVGRLVEAIGNFKPPLALIKEIHDRTEGNPFFIAEVSRDLAQRTADRSQNIDSGESFTIPDGVREVIGVRLNRLSEECGQTLRTAAVIGREFELDLMKMLLPELSAEKFFEVLEEALAAGIVEEMAGAAGRCRFTHVLIQETLSQEFSAARRSGLHGAIGEALEKLYADDLGAHASELAYHFAWADSVPGDRRLARYSLIVGERAMATYAWEEALGYFHRGLAAKDGQSMDADSAALLFGLGRSQAATLGRHRIHDAVNTVRPAFDYYVAAGDLPAALAIAEFPFISLHESGGLSQLLAEALKLVQSDSHQAGRLLVRYGIALFFEFGNFGTAMEALIGALAIAQNENDTALEITVLSRMASTHMMNLDPQMSLENSLRAIELNHHVSQAQLDAGVPWWAAAALVALGDLEGASPHATASLALAEKRGSHFSAVQGLFANEAVAHLKGDWDTARDFSDRGMVVDDRDVRIVSNRAILEYELGDIDRGDAYLERLVETMHLTPPGPTLECSITSITIGIAAQITGSARQFDVAEAAASTVLASPSPVSYFAQLARTGLALIAVERGDVAAASEQYDALQKWKITLTIMNLMCGHHVLGLLARTMGRMDDAIAHFENSLAFCRKAGARPELAWTSYDYADTLLQRDNPGDHSNALSLVDQALAISTELRMRPLLERAVALQEKASLVLVKTPEYPVGLTSREVEVLCLLASGKSNAGIATELVLSVRTVERHISNIYGKIGSTGRANATAFAFSNGLIPTK